VKQLASDEWLLEADRIQKIGQNSEQWSQIVMS